MRPSFQQLRVFEAVARLGSYTRAAQELHLAQPTVSVRMKELAEAIGLPLVEMRGRQLRLTAVGESLLKTARAMFSAWSAFEMEVSETRGLVRGQLRLAAVTTAEYFLPALLAPFAQAHPGIRVELAVENRDAVVRRLEQGLDDLTVMMMPPAHLELVATPFLDNPLVALAPLGHPLAQARRIALSRFAAEPLLLRERGSGTRMALEQLFDEHGLALDARMELGSNEAVKHAVAAGLGLAVLSAHTVGDHPGRDGLVVLPVAGFPLRRSWFLVHPQHHAPSPAARAFLRSLAATQGRAS